MLSSCLKLQAGITSSSPSIKLLFCLVPLHYAPQTWTNNQIGVNSGKINSGSSSEMPRYSACCAATPRAMWLGSKARYAIVHAVWFPGNRVGGTEGWLCQASLYQWGLLGSNSPGHSKGWKGNSSGSLIQKKTVNLKFRNVSWNGKWNYDGGRGLCLVLHALLTDCNK